ncbi:MAG: efflux RND transporter periplasmic adaptor subunit, partial [Phycisphaeraceae bacterium]|nr:efflux RND transporter periplasmic adaptor subunit [Phycisphaeraceae bacterium]
GPLTRTLRAVGHVDYDETTRRDINVKTPGWIEKLHVERLGDRVDKNQPLFDFYSPVLYSAQEEYLLALRRKQSLQPNASESMRRSVEQLLESARTKLRYLDVNDAQISELSRRNKPAKTMTVRSPFQGVVIAKHAREGMRVNETMRIYQLADLSKVWVMVSLYEYQTPFVSVGQKAVMKLPYIPGQTFEGEVVYIYPYLNEKTRQLRIRMEFDNPNGLLKPGMFANVELSSRLAEKRTLAPTSAVLDTGRRTVAFVSLGEGRFEPREVTTGIETESGKVEIIDGLKPGEQVVVSGQFLLDSEAKIREALAKMIEGTPASEQTSAAAEAPIQSELNQLPPEAAELIGRSLNAYTAIGRTLAADKVQGVAAEARTLAEAMDRLVNVPLPGHPHFWHRHDEVATVRGKALALTKPQAIKEARELYYDLSTSLAKLITATGVPPAYGKPVQQLHCPMHKEGQGGSIWLQTDTKVRNPYFGSRMLRCYDKRVALPITGGSNEKQDP